MIDIAADETTATEHDAARSSGPDMVTHDHTVLVLQGGGALGAYQAGVYEGMAEQGIAPDWVTGVSIGAINGALIAGNPPERRLEQLREFWNRVSSGMPSSVLAQLDPLRGGLNRLSALAAATFGVPGFFSPRMPPAFFALDGTPEALSIYDTSPLRETLHELIDFDFLNSKDCVRLSVGSVNLHTGNSLYFDNRERKLGPDHIMASGSLPPGFPPIMIEGDHYWDGGLVSNSPLWYVLDDSPNIDALIVQVDLFSAKGELPVNLDQVLEREKDIRYSSKTRFNTKRVQELENMRRAFGRLMQKLPPKLYKDPDYKLLKPLCDQKRHITITHLINRRFAHSTNSKDYEFSRTTVRQLWETGLEDMRRTCAHRDWPKAKESVSGVRVFDLLR
jgi:NTE family protein